MKSFLVALLLAIFQHESYAVNEAAYISTSGGSTQVVELTTVPQRPSDMTTGKYVLVIVDEVAFKVFRRDHPKFFKEFDVYKRGILPRLPIIVKFDKNITGEDAVHIIQTLVDNNDVNVIDTTPKAELAEATRKKINQIFKADNSARGPYSLDSNRIMLDMKLAQFE